MIKTRRVRHELRATPLPLHETVPVQVQAKLNAALMKTRRPVKLPLRVEVVPLDAVTHAAKAAEQRLPAIARVAPRLRFRERRSGRFSFCITTHLNQADSSISVSKFLEVK